MLDENGKQPGRPVIHPQRVNSAGPVCIRTANNIGVEMAQSLELPGDCRIEFLKTKGNGASWQIVIARFSEQHPRFEPWLGRLRGYGTSEDGAALDLLRHRRTVSS
jgi:hypothetical protein